MNLQFFDKCNVRLQLEPRIGVDIFDALKEAWDLITTDEAGPEILTFKFNGFVITMEQK